VSLINEHLPPDIRVLDVVQTTRKFCAKTSRDRVRYQYMIPSFMLHDRTNLRQIIESHIAMGARRATETGNFTLPLLSSEEVSILRQALLSYRVSEGQIEKLRETLDRFVGTHRFHNYTRGVSSDDPSASRFIHSFSVDEPFVDKFGMQWIPTRVIGQSFLLNQIRKMISMALDVAREFCTLQVMDDSFAKDRRMRLNIAPSQGLFLEMSYYDVYNRKSHENPNSSKKVNELNWHSCGNTPAVLRWRHFKESVILGHISEEEATQGNFIQYLFLQEYCFGKRYQKESDAEENDEANPS